ncbi:retinoblastoma-binding protein 5 isoform X1 [Tripterygium wilfordii]|uniref:Retinoblastoma-binding protein 5 isoform X1 n=1 Tax=Tripterygium wilfordii TaxID=458696 RepID=A0A7J7BZK3_TRIWF|nr:retinoblastoma-binding protein 5 isoform X1 [Tripterygium wilfordii]
MTVQVSEGLRVGRCSNILLSISLFHFPCIKTGCADGRCIMWDFETRVVAKQLQDKDCAAAITIVKESDVDEDDEIDIMTMDNDDFSDSDMSHEELCYLPASSCPDIPEHQDKFVGISLKLLDSNHSGSPFSEAGQDDQAMNRATSLLEGFLFCFGKDFRSLGGSSLCLEEGLCFLGNGLAMK